MIFCLGVIVSNDTQMSSLMKDDIKCWKAKRNRALILDLIRGKTTVAVANRAYDLNPSELE